MDATEQLPVDGSAAPAPAAVEGSGSPHVVMRRTVNVAGAAILIECREDGTVLVNGDVVDPAPKSAGHVRLWGSAC
jgi:hypothetical protein